MCELESTESSMPTFLHLSIIAWSQQFILLKYNVIIYFGHRSGLTV